jgi:hypothetical protein
MIPNLYTKLLEMLVLKNMELPIMPIWKIETSTILNDN